MASNLENSQNERKVAEATREGAAVLARKAYTDRATAAALQDT